MTELFENLPFENLYWNQMETFPLEELHALQLARLQLTVERVRNLPMYRSFFEQNSVAESDLHSLADVCRLPFTTGDMLRLHFPYGYQFVPRHEISRIQTEDGILTAFTRRDLQIQADLASRFLYADGVRSNNIVQISVPFGRSSLAFALQDGLENIGAAAIPANNSEVPEDTLRAVASLGINGLCADGASLLSLCETAKKSGIPLSLRYAHIPSSPSAEDIRRQIQSYFPLKTYLFFTHPAFFGAGCAGECHLQDGMHLQEDIFLFECLDSITLEPVPEGTPGELVVTDLFREAQPLLRFRTGIQVIMNQEPCACGRTGRRIKLV